MPNNPLGQLIYPEGCVLSLNKCNPVQSNSFPIRIMHIHSFIWWRHKSVCRSCTGIIFHGPSLTPEYYGIYGSRACMKYDTHLSIIANSMAYNMVCSMVTWESQYDTRSTPLRMENVLIIIKFSTCRMVDCVNIECLVLENEDSALSFCILQFHWFYWFWYFSIILSQ